MHHCMSLESLTLACDFSDQCSPKHVMFGTPALVSLVLPESQGHRAVQGMDTTITTTVRFTASCNCLTHCFSAVCPWRTCWSAAALPAALRTIIDARSRGRPCSYSISVLRAGMCSCHDTFRAGAQAVTMAMGAITRTMVEGTMAMISSLVSLPFPVPLSSSILLACTPPEQGNCIRICWSYV